MYGVGIIRRYHKAATHQTVIILFRTTQSRIDAVQHIRKEGGCRPLLGGTSHFFIIENGERRNPCNGFLD